MSQTSFLRLLRSVSTDCWSNSFSMSLLAFYTAGLINTGLAIGLITDHYEWLGRVAWAASILTGGLAVLALGYALDRRDARTASDG